MCSASVAITAARNRARFIRRPNILLFMVDDMGWQDTSVKFTPQRTDNNCKYTTPHMERLCRKRHGIYSGLRMRYQLSLTMQHAHWGKRGASWSHKLTLHRDKAEDGLCDSIVMPSWNYNGISRVPGINNTFVGPSFVQELKDNGYHTIHVGKAHFGAFDTPGEDPHHWGFEVNVAGNAAGGLRHISQRV